MGVLQISVSDQAANLLQRLPPPELEVLKRQMTAWLEAKLQVQQDNNVFTLADFQEAMEMTDEDMVLTFGEEYLLANNWKAHEA